MYGRLLDISRPLGENTPVWPGDPKVRVIQHSTVSEDGVRVSSVEVGTHSGTHIDAPSHFLQHGAGIDQTPLDALVGPAVVVDLTGANVPASRRVLQPLLGPERPARVLLKVDRKIVPDGAVIDMSGACYLVERGVRLIGTESMSIEQADGDGSVHRALLGAGIAILEFIDLARISAGTYTLMALPLPLTDLDGSPCRAILSRVLAPLAN